MAFRERHISANDGLRLYVRDYGTALDRRPALLCLGGLTRNSKDFSSFAERHSGDGRRVICPDYRGRGRSGYDPRWQNYNAGSYLRDIRDTLAALEVHRAVVVGTSLGGLLAMAMGAAAPTAIAGAVVNDIGPEIESAGLARLLRLISDDRPRRGWDEAIAVTREILPTLGVQSDEDWLRVAQNTFRETGDGRLRFDWDPNVARPMLLRSYKTPDLWPLFASLERIPVLLLRGENSDLFPAGCFERMRSLRPDMTAVQIPRAGHAPTLQEPAALDALDEFLSHN